MFLMELEIKTLAIWLLIYTSGFLLGPLISGQAFSLMLLDQGSYISKKSHPYTAVRVNTNTMESLIFKGKLW